MDRVKQMLALGVSLPTAIKEILGTTITAWADKHDIDRAVVSRVVNGELTPRPDVCRALAADLGGTPFEWAHELWSAAKPKVEDFSDAAAA